MKKATAEANKKCGKIYECGFCMVACNDDINVTGSKLYMGRACGDKRITYYCTNNCCFAKHRATYTEKFQAQINEYTELLDEMKADYLEVIRGHYTEDEKSYIIMLFNTITSTISFIKSLLARKSSEEITLKLFKAKKYIGEMLEFAHKDAEQVDKCCNMLMTFENPLHIMAYAK